MAFTIGYCTKEKWEAKDLHRLSKIKCFVQEGSISFKFAFFRFNIE
jgi:hypothetical protein